MEKCYKYDVNERNAFMCYLYKKIKSKLSGITAKSVYDMAVTSEIFIFYRKIS